MEPEAPKVVKPDDQNAYPMRFGTGVVQSIFFDAKLFVPRPFEDVLAYFAMTKNGKSVIAQCPDSGMTTRETGE